MLTSNKEKKMSIDMENDKH